MSISKMSLDCVKQYKVNLPEEVSKIKVVTDKIMEFGPTNRQVIVFVRTQKLAEMLHQALVENESYYVSTIHGALTKQDRDAVVQLFNNRFTQVLITTDALADEDVDQSIVSLVVNFDLPLMRDSQEPDTDVYLQRLCSTGAVFNLLCGDKDSMTMEKIEKHIHHSAIKVASWTSVEDFRVAFKEAGLRN